MSDRHLDCASSNVDGPKVCNRARLSCPKHSHSSVRSVHASSFKAERQRDIFPLPMPAVLPSADAAAAARSRSTRKHMRKHHISSLSHEAVCCLNDLVGLPAGNVSAHLKDKQSACLGHIHSLCKEFGAPPDELSPSGALTELCKDSPSYVGSSTCVPFNEDLVSWPPQGSKAVDATSVLGSEARDMLIGWKSRLLRSPSDAAAQLVASGISRPYIDPALRNRSEYSKFLLWLASCDMVAWKINLPQKIGVFFVKKKNNQQRIIFDTRVCNCDFLPLETTRLPSVGSLAAIEALSNSSMYFSQGDVVNAFYHVKVPDDLAEMFA